MRYISRFASHPVVAAIIAFAIVCLCGVAVYSALDQGAWFAAAAMAFVGAHNAVNGVKEASKAIRDRRSAM